MVKLFLFWNNKAQIKSILYPSLKTNEREIVWKYIHKHTVAPTVKSLPSRIAYATEGGSLHDAGRHVIDKGGGTQTPQSLHLKSM